MAVKIFINYSSKDRPYLDKLKSQLAILKRGELITLWDRSQLASGIVKDQIEEELEASEMMLLLISGNYLSDNERIYNCYELQKLAIEKGMLIIPIIITPCLWNIDPDLGKLRALPNQTEEGKSISSWLNEDAAYMNVVEGIRASLEAAKEQSKDIKKVFTENVPNNLPEDSKEEPQERSTKSTNMEYYENGYALLIGIKYEHWRRLSPRLVLNGTLNDIRDLGNHFRNLKKAAFNPDKVIELTETEATADGIVNAFQRLEGKVTEDANVLIYFSGHGGEKGTDYFLAPYDFDIEKFWDDVPNEKNNVVTARQFSSMISMLNAKKKLVILDCCHAENIPVTKSLEISSNNFLKGFVEKLQSNKSETNEKGLQEDLDKGGGSIILTSCQANEKSLDIGTNGLFTQVLLEALNGKGNAKNDGWVRFEDLQRYVRREVPSRAAPHPQHPVLHVSALRAEEFIICAYDIVKAKGLGKIKTVTVLDNFKKKLIDKLDEERSQGVREVIKDIRESPYKYNKSKLTQFKHEFEDNKADSEYYERFKTFIDGIKTDF